MTLADARDLISNDHLEKNDIQTWADIGCGSGLFSRALLGLLNNASKIYAVDKQPVLFKEKQIEFIKKDFDQDALPLPLLNGIMMANAIHFIKDKKALLKKLAALLKPDGIFILVEYDTLSPNRWVPYPIDFTSAQKLFADAGFAHAEKISERPSIYQSAGIYAACIYR